MSGQIVPIYVKSLFGQRLVVAESQSYSITKKFADRIRTVNGFSKNRKLYVCYQGKDLQLMETKTLNWKTSSLFNHSGKNSGSNVLKNTDRD